MKTKMSKSDVILCLVLALAMIAAFQCQKSNPLGDEDEDEQASYKRVNSVNMKMKTKMSKSAVILALAMIVALQCQRTKSVKMKMSNAALMLLALAMIVSQLEQKRVCLLRVYAMDMRTNSVHQQKMLCNHAVNNFRA
eukprot:Gb_22366 [translate_table: standard]